MIKLHAVRRYIASLLLVTVPIIGYTAGPASAYDRATVYNRTNLAVSGTVHYAACRSDNFSVAGGAVTASGITQTQTTMGTSRGACLITRITATVGGKAAEAYTSSGTSYSQFLVVSIGLRVPRRFDAAIGKRTGRRNRKPGLFHRQQYELSRRSKPRPGRVLVLRRRRTRAKRSIARPAPSGSRSAINSRWIWLNTNRSRRACCPLPRSSAASSWEL